MALVPQIRLSGSEEYELRWRAAQHPRFQREVLRAKVVLLAAAGYSDAEIARRLRCTDKTAGKWRKRFASERLAGLRERPRAGHRQSPSDSGRRAAGRVAPPDLALVAS
jgi:hypothetical protein